MKRSICLAIAAYAGTSFALSQQRGNDVTVPLHALQPDYLVPYVIPVETSVKRILDRVFHYLDSTTPPVFINRVTKAVVSNVADPDTNTVLKPGDFRLTSYEWGVTYGAMLAVADATGDKRYSDYSKKRLELIAHAVPAFRSLYQKTPKNSNPLRAVIEPKALDDCGAMCAAAVKTLRAGGSSALRIMIDTYINFISTGQQRLTDGTLARNRPQKNTLWLDDLYMSVPALAQMGKLTGEVKYFDDAVKQVVQFSDRMFNKDINLYMHGWVEAMNPHPEFHWARANGWALLAMTELLDVLPGNHPGYAKVLNQFQAQAKGLAFYQTDKGFWHQLLDKNDSYLETSATAIYTYCIAKAINKKWLDAKAYGPMCLLAWNAVATKVNNVGQVEGTCVGTGMAFDPAFYYYRPINVFAAHGYGPVLLAGAEIINLLKGHTFEMNDSSIQLKEK
ncbi:MAG: glycoside hydrolase family 105 protein [Chitinophagales bacterium]